MLKLIKRHFPASKDKWKVYLKIFLPIVIGSTMYALNGVVDNFMVGHIEQGQAALGAINSWTSIITYWFLGTAAAGSVIAGQFYFSKKYEVVKEVSRYRFYLCIIPAAIMSIVAWCDPDILTKAFYHGNKNNPIRFNPKLMDNARHYARVIAVQWILISISFNYGNQFRELGFGKLTMLWGMGTLVTNITFNAILMYGAGMGVEGAAVASVAARIVALSSGLILTKKLKLPLETKPWMIFKVSWHTRKLIWGRGVYLMAIFTGGIFVIFRTSFYDTGYPEGTLGTGVGGLAVVALTGALMNVFTTTFSSLSSMSAKFVASELGKNNLKQAKINADELKGFSTLVSAFMSLILIAFAFLVPHLTFLAQDKYDTVSNELSMDGHKQLLEVSKALMVIALYYPMWIWFSSSYRSGNTGGKGGWFALVDWLVSGLQLGWLALIGFKIIPAWEFAQSRFWVMYIIFFLSDLFKLLFQEILYYKYKWLHSLTQKTVKGIEFEAKSEIQELAELKNDY